MSCEDKENAFKNKLAEEQLTLAAELKAIESDTEQKASQIAADFEADNDLAEGVGAAAGTAIGGYFGGPAGAAAGSVVGKQIGSLFTLEVGTRQEKVILDVPQTTMEIQDFSFDLPTVVLKDSDISFDIPTIEMRRQRGPNIPEVRTRMEQRCIGSGSFKVCTDIPIVYTEMVETYYDMPVTVMKTNHIVVGLPVIEMRREVIKISIPQITMKPTEFSADIPYITLRFIKDAGKRTAALAAALAQSAQEAATQKQIAFKDRLRVAVAPLLLEMFNCFREVILASKMEASSKFSSEISELTAAVTALVAKGVPEGDSDLINSRKLLDDCILKRENALKPFDDSLTKFDASVKISLEQFLGETPADTNSSAKGGLNIRLDPKGGSKDVNSNQLLKITGVIGLIQYMPSR